MRVEVSIFRGVQIRQVVLTLYIALSQSSKDKGEVFRGTTACGRGWFLLQSVSSSLFYFLFQARHDEVRSLWSVLHSAKTYYQLCHGVRLSSTQSALALYVLPHTADLPQCSQICTGRRGEKENERTVIFQCGRNTFNPPLICTDSLQPTELPSGVVYVCICIIP